MWKIPPKYLCRNHLLGEHAEMHMFVGSIRKGTSMEGYILNGLVEIPHIQMRHDMLAAEMRKRGYNHQSPLSMNAYYGYDTGKVALAKSYRDLLARCPECAERIPKYLRNKHG